MSLARQPHPVKTLFTVIPLAPRIVKWYQAEAKRRGISPTALLIRALVDWAHEQERKNEN